MGKGRHKRSELWERFETSSDPLPVNVVAIETIASCNRVCGYCPVSAHPKRHGRLADQVVFGIFDQLGEVNYSKKLTFHFYNEPLLDKRIDSFVDYAARKVPNAFRLLTTNGDLLDRARAEYLLDGRASEIAVSAHDKATFERFSSIRDELRPEFRGRLRIRSYYRVGDGTRAARITNRAASIDLTAGGYSADEVTEAGPDGCNRVELNIDYAGNVHPCCMDFTGGYILGNIYEDSLLDIWRRSVAQFQDHFLGNYTKEVCLKCAKVDVAPNAHETPQVVAK